MNKLFTKIAAATLGVAMAIGVGVAVNHKSDARVARATPSTMTFTPSSKSAGTFSGGATGMSASYSNGYNSASQITKGNSATLTISLTGSNQYEIKGITLSMKNNASSGAGTVVASIGTTAISETLSATGYGSTYADKTLTLKTASTTNYLDSTHSLSIVVACSTSSVYCQSYSISYEQVSSEPMVKIASSVSYLKAVGDTHTISASIQNPKGTEGSISFGSTNTSVATINSSTGEIEAKGIGTTTISATATGAISDSFELKVLSAHTGESESQALTATEALNFYNNLTGDEKTADYYFAGYVTEFGDYESADYILDNSELDLYDPQAGQGVDLNDVVEGKSYVVALGSMTNDSTDIYSYQPTILSVVNPVLDHIVVSGELTTASYKNNDTQWDPSGLVVTAYYTNESSRTVVADSWTYDIASPFDVDLEGAASKDVTLTITAHYGELTASASKTVTITKNNLTSLSFNGTKKTQFAVGELFSFGTAALRANHTTGYTLVALDNPNLVVKLGESTINVASYKFVIGDNGKTITLSYSEHGITKSTNYDITVVFSYTASSTASALATANGWKNETEVSSFTLDKVVTISMSSSGTTPKYYTSGTAIRTYQSGETGTTSIDIQLPSYGFTLTSVTFTYTKNSNGILVLNDGEYETTVDTDVPYSCSGTSLSLTVGSTSGTSGQARITAISVTYSLDSFGQWCYSLLNDLTCDEDGITAPSTTKWGQLSTSFSGLGDGVATYAKTLTAKENGIITEQAMARYDYIVGKYNVHLKMTTEYPDFIDRKPEDPISGSKISTIETNKVNTTGIIILVASLTTVSLLGVLLVLKKKKEQ